MTPYTTYGLESYKSRVIHWTFLPNTGLPMSLLLTVIGLAFPSRILIARGIGIPQLSHRTRRTLALTEQVLALALRPTAAASWALLIRMTTERTLVSIPLVIMMCLEMLSRIGDLFQYARHGLIMALFQFAHLGWHARSSSLLLRDGSLPS